LQFSWFLQILISLHSLKPKTLTMPQQCKKAQMSLGHVDLPGFIDQMPICARDLSAHEWGDAHLCRSFQIFLHYDYPPVRGFTYLGTYPGTYPTRANIPAQHWCTTLITGTILEGLGYWKVPWYWYWSLNERTNQASMTLGNTNPLLLVLLVLGRDMRWIPAPISVPAW
jgi:hypothetical protein